MSHSSPSTQRSAESLPLIMPHSKSSQGPRFSRPYFKHVPVEQKRFDDLQLGICYGALHYALLKGRFVSTIPSGKQLKLMLGLTPLSMNPAMRMSPEVAFTFYDCRFLPGSSRVMRESASSVSE